MKNILLILLYFYMVSPATPSDREIYRSNEKVICLVSYYQNISSDSKIGSFDKIKRYRIGILVNSTGLLMVSSDVYPVSLDFVSGGGSFLSGMPSDFKVKLYDGTEYPAKFLGKDDQARMAFIQIEAGEESLSLHYANFQETTSVGIADTVHVLEMLTQNYNFSPLFTTHQINAVIESPQRKFLINNFSPALSAGGLVLNSEGQAIGVVISQVFDFNFMHSADFEDLQKNYLEIAPAEWFVELIRNPPDILDNQLAQKSWLGISMQALNKELRTYWKVPQEGGIIVNRVYPESPAERAGLKTADVILAIDDSTLDISRDEETARLRNLILSYPPESTIQLKIFRDGKVKTQQVKLTAAPKVIGVAEGYAVPEWGFEIRELTRDILYQDDLPLNTPGVFVYQVDRASAAGIGGLQIGDIIQEMNGIKIKNFEEAQEIISEALSKKNKIHMLKVLSNRNTRFVFIDLQK